MRRPAAVAVLALALVASACGDGGRKTPPLSIPDQVEGQVAVPDSLASPACRLAVGTGIGAEVVSVQTDLPASRVLAPGDVITEVDGVGVTESEDLIAVVRSLQVGDSVSVRVFRSGVDPFDAEVDLVEQESGAPMLGIGVRTAVELQDARSIEAGGRSTHH
jgi:S1-C subfamily serine protease